MSDERYGRLEDAVMRIAKEVVLHGERLGRLEVESKKLVKLGELDDRVTDFAEDIEAARRDRTLRDYYFNENQAKFQKLDDRLRKLEGEENDDTR